jgi:16S rRNA (uracil1498-N3)-methyltransferase
MNLPFFYLESETAKEGVVTLNEDSSRHIIQVLRMKAGERLRLTDGAGNSYTAAIEKEHKKATVVTILNRSYEERPPKKSTIAISLIKNTARFEWFLEKATELGIYAIQPLICNRTEKQHFRLDRMRNIVISAMLQSQQCWLPQLTEPVSLEQFINRQDTAHKLIAHCMEGSKNHFYEEAGKHAETVIMIGPEGDFTADEIEASIAKLFLPVSLGNTRLRTETAGVAAAVIMQLHSAI